MGNILKAVKRVVDNPITSLKSFYEGRNRVNNMGKALEEYIKDLFAETLKVDNETERDRKHSEVFSYLGKQNNPPDLMIRGGDAIEAKKIQGNASNIQFNSSYPKSRLYVDNPMLLPSCIKCEDWKVKDIIYAIGSTTDKNIKYLWLVYGDCFIADNKVYKEVIRVIENGINSIPNVEHKDTKELGQIKKVDPLDVSFLRVRGMWVIQNPNKLFSPSLDCYDKTASFQVTCLMRKEKFNSFSDEDKNALLNLDKENYSIQDVQIKDPDNPAKLIDAKLITYRIYE